MKHDYKSLHAEYMKRYPHLPISLEVARQYTLIYPLTTYEKDTARLADWVGSQGLYEQGAEEEW